MGRHQFFGFQNQIVILFQFEFRVGSGSLDFRRRMALFNSSRVPELSLLREERVPQPQVRGG